MKEYMKTEPTSSWKIFVVRLNEHASHGWQMVGPIITEMAGPVTERYSVLMEREVPPLDEVWIQCRGRGHGE